MPSSRSRSSFPAALPILVVVITVVVFSPALNNQFVDWDDNAALMENLRFRAIGWTQLRWMFTTFYMGHYQPLSWMSFAIDYHFWGLNPFGYHLTNVLFHAANAGLFYCLALRLLTISKIDGCAWTLRIGAGLTALLFSIHPLRVESVAWATERRDVLSAFFILLSVLAYLRAATVDASRSHRRWMSLALLAYFLSLLSKAAGISFPVVLLTLDVIPLKRLGNRETGWFTPATRKVWSEKLPFAALAVAAAVTAAMAQYTSGAMKGLENHTLMQRLAQACFGLLFYVQKTIFPARLYPMYDLPTALNPWQPMYIASFLGVLALTAVLFIFRRRWPAGLAAWVSYAALIAPVSGVAQSGSQIVADRYSYLSCLSLAVLAGAGAVYCWRHRLNKNPLTGVLACAAAAGILFLAALATVKQIAVWHDSETLFRYVAAYTPNPSKTALNNLGVVLAQRGQLDEAVVYFTHAAERDPNFNDAKVNLADALAAQGNTEKAIAQYQEALRLNPNLLSAQHRLALALLRQGKIDEALEHYQKAVEINPSFLEGQNNFGLLLAAKGRYAEAITHLRTALEIDPKFPIAHVNLGDVLIALGQRDEGIEHFRTAIALDPNLASARASLAKALAAEPRGAAVQR